MTSSKVDSSQPEVSSFKNKGNYLTDREVLDLYRKRYTVDASSYALWLLELILFWLVYILLPKWIFWVSLGGYLFLLFYCAFKSKYDDWLDKEFKERFL